MAFSLDPYNHRFEELLQDGVTAAKNGERERARTLLERAARLNSSDARPWMWLSSITEDPDEQRKFLEYAVAAEPDNAAARRALVTLSGKLDQSRLVPEGVGVEPLRPQHAHEAAGQTIQCPQCGGRMYFDARESALTCSYCGHKQPVEAQQATDAAEQPVDFVLPTTRAHRWAEARRQVTCESCGAVALLDPGRMTSNCTYCGSNQLIDSPEAVELVEPQVIGLIGSGEKEIRRQVIEWLSSGLFAPDNLVKDAASLELRPAYYPFWTFDGTLEVPWTCEVNEGTGENRRWVARKGSEFEFFDDILVPGLTALTQQELSRIEPFLLKDVVAFKPDHLAGWPAIGYDRTLADASLLAREKVVSQVRRRLNAAIEPGHEKRNVRAAGGKWSGLTFKNVLLPMWAGSYRFHGVQYRLLVNGQTGKVSGTKPRDNLKVIMVAVGGALLLLLLGMVLFWLWSSYAG